ncbi:MAG: hypothetical protein N4A70_08040 [Pelagimonas sp.]|jgi:hypothetical protein|nr:hypothetical protein [Pelagimonas sp.]
MKEEWVLQALTQIGSFALENGLEETCEALAQLERVATNEVQARKRERLKKLN